jgi:hypothetical protein
MTHEAQDTVQGASLLLELSKGYQPPLPGATSSRKEDGLAPVLRASCCLHVLELPMPSILADLRPPASPDLRPPASPPPRHTRHLLCVPCEGPSPNFPSEPQRSQPSKRKAGHCSDLRDMQPTQAKRRKPLCEHAVRSDPEP